MDRVVMFLLFHPHPALHVCLSQMFVVKVRGQYSKERYKTRKLSNEFCTNCRNPENTTVVRPAIQRFNLLWASDVIQNRMCNDWYKDVKKIDVKL